MGKENQKSINWQASAVPKGIDPCMLWAACSLVTTAPESSLWGSDGGTGIFYEKPFKYIETHWILIGIFVYGGNGRGIICSAVIWCRD